MIYELMIKLAFHRLLVSCVIDFFIYMWLKGEGLFSHNKIIRNL